VYTRKNEDFEEPQEQPQKQPERTNTVLLLKNTYTHIKENGGSVEMTLDQLRNRIQDYQGRADEAAKKIEACVESELDTKFWKECFQGRCKSLSYWKTAYNMLDGQLKQIETYKGEGTE
jgi:hypothetical protein